MASSIIPFCFICIMVSAVVSANNSMKLDDSVEDPSINEAYPLWSSIGYGNIHASQHNRATNSEEDKELKDVFLGNLQRGQMSVVNVESFGAVGKGQTDETQAFVDAWKTACSMANSVFLVPEGKEYLVKPVKLSGPCHEDGGQIVQIAGKVIAPEDPETWDQESPRNWLVFSNLKGITIQGGGVFDGSGEKWWAESCKINKTNPCKSAPTALTIDSSSDVKLRDLKFQNSQQMHIVISHSFGVEITNLQVVAPGDSPNTDGIHITGSQNVVVQSSSIATGDDCISIVSGSADIKIKDVVCGPGHGISIGSLGKDNSEAYVSAVVVDSVQLKGTTNGLRIKTWQGGRGFARGFKFQNVKMENVSNPIIIDQFYCDSPNECKNQSSAVRVSEVMFMNVRGTSKSKEAIKFMCSDTVPCEKVVMMNVDLKRDDGNNAEFSCNNAQGITVGDIDPSVDCLQNVDQLSPSDLCLQTNSPSAFLV